MSDDKGDSSAPEPHFPLRPLTLAPPLMHQSVFYEVILPTLVTNTAFIGITTLDSEHNVVSCLMEESEKDGRKVFNVIRFEHVCEDCKIKGTTEWCNHSVHIE